MKPQEWQILKDKAIALVERTPGINQDSFAVKLGYSPTRYSSRNGRSKRNQTISTLIDELIESEIIRAEAVPFAAPGDPLLLYPFDYVEPKKKLFQPVSTNTQGNLKTYIDPSFVGSWKPKEKAMRVDVAEAEDKPPPTATTMTKATQTLARDKLIAALDEIEAAGKSFTLMDLTDRADLSDSVIYKHQDLLQRAKRLQSRFKQAASTGSKSIAPASTQVLNPPPTGDLELGKPKPDLVAELESLKAQNQALQLQLESAASAPSLVDMLAAEVESCSALLREVEAQEKKLTADKQSAIAKLQAAQHLLSVLTGEAPSLKLEMVARNGNGKQLSPVGEKWEA